MEPIEFDLKLEEKDIIEFNFIHIYKERKAKILILLGLLTIILGFFGLTISNSFDEFLLYLLCLSIGIIALIVFPIMLLIKSKSIFANDSFIKKTLRYNFSQLGFNISSENGNTKINWYEIYRIIEFNNLLLIYVSKNKAFAIPKRMIREEYEGLILILKQYAPKEKLKLYKSN